MPNITKLIEGKDQELKNILASFPDLVKKGQEQLISEKYQEAVSKLTQIYYLQMHALDNDLKIRPEYKEDKFNELASQLQEDIVKIGGFIDSLNKE